MNFPEAERLLSKVEGYIIELLKVEIQNQLIKLSKCCFPLNLKLYLR